MCFLLKSVWRDERPNTSFQSPKQPSHECELFLTLLLTCDEHWSAQVFEVLKWFISKSSLQVSEIFAPQLQNHGLFPSFVFPVATSFPLYHSHSYLLFSLQLLLEAVTGKSISKMHAKPRYLSGNGMKTRRSSFPKHPAPVRCISAIGDSSARWQTRWASEMKTPAKGGAVAIFTAGVLSQPKLRLISTFSRCKMVVWMG